MDTCDKCGQEIIPAYNNLCVVAAIAEAIEDDLRSDKFILMHVNATRFNKPARHFLLVRNGDTLFCEGSPSRGQFIEGQPRDMRGYEYTEGLEKLYRAAWAKAQELYP